MIDFLKVYYNYIPVAVLAGIFVDLIVGDPAFLLHPVQIIGKLIELLERVLRRGERESSAIGFVLGIVEVLGVTSVTGIVSFGICYIAYRINTYLLLAVMIVMCWQCIAAKSLRDAALAVYAPLSKGDVEGARKAVSMIVGRDTQSLDDKGITKAAVETVAENTNDGVICPLFYQMLGGPVLSFIYKAVSTMDSMIGYKNERYMYFGRFAAKTDDVFAYVPARLSAAFMIAGTAALEVLGRAFGAKNSDGCGADKDGNTFTGYSTKGAIRIFIRDRYNHASPNSAQCESVCAGALGLKLAGPASYFGKIHDKQFIGDETRIIEPDDIKRSIVLMNVTTLFSTIIYIVIICIVKNVFVLPL